MPIRQFKAKLKAFIPARVRDDRPPRSERPAAGPAGQDVAAGLLRDEQP
jgi:hypothetical protein